MAVGQINEHSDIRVKYTQRKTGRTITHLIFDIKPEPKAKTEKPAKASKRVVIDEAYYANNEVPFSKGKIVGLRSVDKDRVVKDLTNRIYATRNSLVHSKDGDKARYTPFKDERALVMEIPLMRFVAEMVILAVSELT